MVPWNSLYHKKTERRRYKKRCWRQALSFLSDNPRHHHYKEKEDARDCSHKSRNIFVKNIFNNSALHIRNPTYYMYTYMYSFWRSNFMQLWIILYLHWAWQQPNGGSSFLLQVSKAKLFLISNFNCFFSWLHCKFYPMKTMGTGNYGVPSEKTCTIYGKEL